MEDETVRVKDDKGRPNPSIQADYDKKMLTPQMMKTSPSITTMIWMMKSLWKFKKLKTSSTHAPFCFDDYYHVAELFANY